MSNLEDDFHEILPFELRLMAYEEAFLEMTTGEEVPITAIIGVCLQQTDVVVEDGGHNESMVYKVCVCRCVACDCDSCMNGLTSWDKEYNVDCTCVGCKEC